MGEIDDRKGISKCGDMVVFFPPNSSFTIVTHISISEISHEELVMEVFKLRRALTDLSIKVDFMETPLGPFLWQIEDFQYHKDRSLQNRFYHLKSPSFYTSQNGYKVFACLYPSFDGKYLE